MGSYLLIMREIDELARDVLSHSEFREADDISRSLAIGNKSMRREARYRLIEIVKPPPKRPLSYAQQEITHLPQATRNSIRYLGDYIDLLVKGMAFELTKDPRCKKSSLGANVRKLNPERHAVSLELINNLRRYDSLFYNPGKHDFSMPPPGREHHFTSMETVFDVFVTFKLADEIKKASQFANLISLDKETIEDFEDY